MLLVLPFIFSLILIMIMLIIESFVIQAVQNIVQ
jgi:hypothetical protein